MNNQTLESIRDMCEKNIALMGQIQQSDIFPIETRQAALDAHIAFLKMQVSLFSPEVREAYEKLKN